MQQPLKILWVLAAFSAVLAMSAFAWFGYFSDIFIQSRGDTTIAQYSALLPKGWETYRGEGWSVGYPKDFEIHTRSDETVYFVPSGEAERKTYFLVQKQDISLDAFVIARKAEGYRAPDSVMIANYPAVKYTIGNNRVEYGISYRGHVILVASDEPSDELIAIMFATFAMISE